MNSPANRLPYDPTTANHDDREPPAKRQKTQACSRCRRGKQKCDGERPYSNCSRNGEQCHEVMSAVYTRPSFSPSISGSSPHMPLAWLGDIASLEERISRLENDRVRPQYQPSTIAFNNDNVEPLQSNDTMQRVPNTGSRTENEVSLTKSAPAIGLLATFARSEDMNPVPIGAQESVLTRRHSTQTDTLNVLDKTEEDALFEIYQQRVHCRYPFLRLTELRDVCKRPTDHWINYFTSMVFSIGLLLERGNHFDVARYSHQAFYRTAVTQYLSHVFAQSDRLLHIQAYLLLAMHAIYSPSTERIISIASATMRYCVMAQLHLADAEPRSSDVAGKV